VNYRWHPLNEGQTWKLVVDRRLRASISFLGRTQVAFGGGQMRWKVQHHGDMENVRDLPEFDDLDKAKAWALALARLS
jgi:hypothetical protein